MCVCEAMGFSEHVVFSVWSLTWLQRIGSFPPTVLLWSRPCSYSTFSMVILKSTLEAPSCCEALCILIWDSSHLSVWTPLYPHLQEFPWNAGKSQRRHSLVFQWRRGLCRLWMRRRGNFYPCRNLEIQTCSNSFFKKMMNMDSEGVKRKYQFWTWPEVYTRGGQQRPQHGPTRADAVIDSQWGSAACLVVELWNGFVIRYVISKWVIS